MSESSSSSSSSTATAKSDVELEEMLDRMLTRLALCDDSKLQALLASLLPMTISSLSSTSTAVRNRVLEILSHVNKRVKYQPNIGLPLHDLWKIYTEGNAASIVKNFCIVYIEMAFDRIDQQEKQIMAPILIANISKIPQQHQEIVLRIVIKVIGECHSTGVSSEVAEKYRAVTMPQDRELFLDFCLYTILYQPSSQGVGICPGLSVSQAKKVAGNLQLKSDLLLLRKLGILNVIDAMELPAEVVYPLYIAASSDSQEAVIKRGDDLLKKKASGVNFEDVSLLKRLFLLCNGTVGTDISGPDSKIQPANATLRTKILNVFCRSITAANTFPSTLQCIFACIYGHGTTMRLKQSGMEFTVWVFKHARLDQLQMMGPVILTGIIKSLDSNMVSESDSSARDTKTFAYQAIGLLAKRMPQLFRDKIDMAVRLFGALKLEAPTFRSVIQEATVSLAVAYKGAPASVLKDLEGLLLENYQQGQSEARFCAVRWATWIYDLNHCASRFVCMLGTGDSKLDIREMALEGLFPLKEDEQAVDHDISLKFPKLQDMLEFILKQQPRLLESTELRERRLIFSSEVYVFIIKFLLKCFESEIEENEAAGLSSEFLYTLEENEAAGLSSEFLYTLEKLFTLLEHAMVVEGSAALHGCASTALLAIASRTPRAVASHYSQKISWLKQLLGHMDVDTRESAARLIGIASSALPLPTVAALVEELKSSISGSQKPRFESYYGTLCAIGYTAADCVSRKSAISDMLFRSLLTCLVDVVNSESATLASIAMQALGHIGLRVSLPPISEASTSGYPLMMVHERISKILSGDDNKAIQKIVVSLGHACMNEASYSHLKTAMDLIFNLCRSKVENVLFSAGEALSFLWGSVPVTADTILQTNYTSLSMSSRYLKKTMSSSSLERDSKGIIDSDDSSHAMVRDSILKKLFDDLLYSNRREERCAGTVWLLSLTVYCGRHPIIQQILPEIQEAFSNLLGEQNELTQDLASLGMSIVYELGDSSMKEKLVKGLVGTLSGTGKRKRAIKLVENSEVFQEGAIGESLTGGKLSTYKELCSLANEMGQPDLIYKFMDLANHQASLNSKKGAAFGFSKIAIQAGEAFKPYLRDLIPKLVRYQYDPDKSVQDAMAHIWKSLITDPKKTIDDHFDVIVSDLLTQCGSRLWRSREASCLALADIIQGKRYDQVGKHLAMIWTAAFRATDDIKETVRNSGDKLCRAVSSLTIRLCDIKLTEASDSQQAMGIVLPYLLKEGILSKVDGIRKASIAVVMKIAKNAGVALRPHMTDLVSCMLEGLSSLEDQGLNYVELHAENIGLKTEKLESLRISMAKSSPMWETLEQCINVADSESLESLVPHVAQIARSGVGLNTRVGVASFISLLIQRVGADIKPFVNLLVRVLFAAVKEEKSASSKRAFANACGSVLKHATSSQAEMLIEETAALHTGDKNAQLSCAVLIKSFASVAPDVISGYYGELLPIVYISRFEDDKVLSTIFEELWEENTSGEQITLQLYAKEIVSVICSNISSSSWGSKKKAAQAICKLCTGLGESLSSYHRVLLESLTREIPGRLWEGKETLLYALGALAEACHQVIASEDPGAPAAILDLLCSASRKKVKRYREAALSSLEQVIKAFACPEFFNLAFPMLLGMCNSGTPVVESGLAAVANDAVGSASAEAGDSSVPREKILDCVTASIHVADTTDLFNQQDNLMRLLNASLSPELSWIVKTSAWLTVKELCKRLQDILHDHERTSFRAAAASFVLELFSTLPSKVLECIGTIKIAQVHINASECLLELITLRRELPSESAADARVGTVIRNLYEVEKNGEAKSLLKKCLDALETRAAE